jgi:hypothetical protein
MKKSSTTTSKTKRVWYMESWNHEFITPSCVSLTLISGHTVHHQVSTHLEIVHEIFTNWQQQLSSCWLEGQATHCTY